MRERIITATIEEVNSRGFRFTMSDLAKRLSISKSSLYEYFSSKDELVTTILDMILKDLRERQAEIYKSGLSLTEKLQAVLTVTSHTFEPFHNRVYDDLRLAYPEQWKKVAAFRQESMECLTELLMQGMAAASIRHVNLGIIQHILKSTDFSNYYFLKEINMTYPNAVAAFLDIMLYGMVTEKESKIK